MEQEEYQKEEINWSYIEFIDNQDVLDLIEKVYSAILYVLLSMIYFTIGLIQRQCPSAETDRHNCSSG